MQRRHNTKPPDTVRPGASSSLSAGCPTPLQLRFDLRVYRLRPRSPLLDTGFQTPKSAFQVGVIHPEVDLLGGERVVQDAEHRLPHRIERLGALELPAPLPVLDVGRVQE